MTYNGYLLPRFQVLSRSTSVGIAVVALVWASQHVPLSVFMTLAYLRLRRLLPLAIAHALMDGASVLISALLPLLRT